MIYRHNSQTYWPSNIVDEIKLSFFQDEMTHAENFLFIYDKYFYNVNETMKRFFEPSVSIAKK